MSAQAVSRRSFLGHFALASAAAAIVQSPEFLRGGGWFEAVHAAELDITRDTFNGLLAFVVPGTDAYSQAQGVSTTDPGGVDAGAADVLLATVDGSTPFVPSFSAVVGTILNNLAQAVHPGVTGAFGSPFANLSYPEKAVVFQIMDATDSLKVLGGILPAFVAYFCYSEAGAYDPSTRSLLSHPLGWRLSQYQGTADGRDEFLGYFDHKRHL
jgi:hypothetical protein